MMSSNWLVPVAVFVVVLVGLNAVFRLHVSILGSLALTVGISLLFNLFQRR